MTQESLIESKLLIREQADQLFNNTSGSAATQIIVAILFYVLFQNVLNSQLLGLWCITLSLLVLARLILVGFYKKKRALNIEQGLDGFTFLTLLVGVTWACFSLFYLTIDDVGLKYLFFVVICGVAAGAVPILAAWTPAYYANTAPQLFSLPAILLYSNSTVNFFLAVSFVVFCIMLMSLQRNANQSIRLAIQLQHNSDGLVSELSDEIEQREQLIEKRTQELNDSLVEKTAIVNNKLVAIAIVYDRKIEWANSAFEAMLGYEKDEIIGYPTRQFYTNDQDFQAIGEAYKTISDGVVKDELEFMCKDGKHIWVSLRGSIFNEDKGQSLWVFVDITERIKSAEALQLSARVYSNTHDGIIITDINKNIIDVNPAFCRITGYSHEEIIGQNPSFLASDVQSHEFYTEMWQQIEEKGYWQGEIWNRKKTGEDFAELLTISELKDRNGNLTHYVGIFSDITKTKQQQEDLKLLAHYDVLTKLPNRILLSDRFHQAVAYSKRNNSLLAVCFLDLDDFKPINDKFGHEIGDQLLIEVAGRIMSCIREMDTVARLGGDEFALLLNDISSQTQCEETMKRIHHSLSEPYLIGEHVVTVTASCGITLYPHNEGDIDTLLRCADQAMYLAKQAGRNCYQLFDAEEEQKAIDKNNRLAEIGNALTNNEFQLYYQPKVNMVTGKIFGAEALIRWNHPEQGLVPPLEFLPILEGTVLEIQLGEWVIHEALGQLELWRQKDIELEVSINISSAHLLSETFTHQLENVLAKFPAVNSKLFEIEILESTVIGDVYTISKIVDNCQNTLGVSFALDDFGTGYSSLTHLRNLPIDTVKIDQTFTRDMLDDPNDYAIIDGVVALAESFNRNVIAEGVETSEHGLMLLLIGCEQAQGYGIAKPMPADNLVDWLNNYSPNQQWILSGNKHQSKKENERELFRLTTQHWINKFVENIQLEAGTLNNWPIMDITQCPCGFWLKRARRAQLFGNEGLEQLKLVHGKVHELANDILLKYQEGQLDEARNGLAKLQVTFDEMTHILRLCE